MVPKKALRPSKVGGLFWYQHSNKSRYRVQYLLLEARTDTFRAGDTVNGMNVKVREAVREVMSARELSQGELARQLEVDRPSITRLLSGSSGKVPKLWQEILDALDLELIAVPKTKN